MSDKLGLSGYEILFRKMSIITEHNVLRKVYRDLRFYYSASTPGKIALLFEYFKTFKIYSVDFVNGRHSYYLNTESSVKRRKGVFEPRFHCPIKPLGYSISHKAHVINLWTNKTFRSYINFCAIFPL